MDKNKKEANEWLSLYIYAEVEIQELKYMQQAQEIRTSTA